MILYGDLETFSEVPIKHGVYRYAEACEIMLFAYAFDDGPVRMWDCTTEPDMPRDLAEAIEDDSVIVVFQNSMFDRAVLNAHGIRIALHRWRDTMVQAYAHSLQGALDKLGTILGVPQDKKKMTEGKALIQLFCKPRPKNQTIRRATRETHPREWATFIDYADHDIESMRYIHQKLPTWNYTGAELELWHLDQRVNDRGIPVDVDMAVAAIAAAEREKKRLGARASELTGGEVTSTTQRDKLMAHLLAEYGVDLPDMKSDTLERRINDPEIPWQVRELLNNRLDASRASLAKYKAILRSVNKDGRVRGTMQFNGALRTGRAAGRLVQPQNMMRTPKYLTAKGAAGDAMIEEAADAIKEGLVDLVYGRPLEVLSAGVPWVITAPKGKKLICSDLSNIEGRVLAWLAGEQWKLDAFREYDTDQENKAKDLYIIGYSKSFKRAIAEVIADFEAGGNWRQIGKVQELALGYQGAVGAFVSMAAVYGIDLNELAPMAAIIEKSFYDKGAMAWERACEDARTFDLERNVYIVCHAFTQMWRAANPFTVQFWYDLERAIRQAIEKPGDGAQVVGRLKIQRAANWLQIRLPSGRRLCYPNPKVTRPDNYDKTGYNNNSAKISYKGVNQYTRKWQTIESYGGKFAENVTQAVARDVFYSSHLPAEAEGYEIAFHVHDELVTEVPDTDEYSSDVLGEIMTTNPSWADGLPLAAGGYETYRYRKD